MSSSSHNIAVLRGTIAGEPRRTTLASGAMVHEYDVKVKVKVKVNVEAETVTTVPVSWFDPPATGGSIGDGDDVVVVGSVRRRFYRAAGATVSRTDVVADEVIRARRRQAVRRAVDGAIDQLQRSQWP